DDADRQRNFYRVVMQDWIDGSAEDSESLAAQEIGKGENFRNSLPPKFAVLEKEMIGDGATPGMVGPIDQQTGKPKRSLKSRIQALEQQLATTTKNWNDKQRELDSLKAEHSQYVKDWNGDKLAQAVKQAQDNAEAQKKQALAQKDDELKQARQKITDTTQSL